MKALYLTRWCEVGTVADTIKFGEVPPPTTVPVKSEVLIEVKASAINVDDIALSQDSAAGGWFFHGRRPSDAIPVVGGMEYAGVVLAVGPEVTKLKVGDRVCGVQDVSLQKNPGTWAEQTMAPEKCIVLIPADCDISFVQAASVGMAAFVTGDMYKRAKLLSTGNHRCLVVGASGGLGTFMVQLLSRREGGNVHVVGVCSGENADTVRRAGAHDVVDYKVGPFGQQLANAEAFDVVFDFVGGIDTERNAQEVLKRGGKFITAVGPRQGIGDRVLTCSEWYQWACGLTCRLLKSACCCCCTKFTYDMGGGLTLKAEDFNEWVVNQGIRATIAMEVPFEEAPLREALRRVASRHTGGKVVINMEAGVDSGIGKTK